MIAPGIKASWRSQRVILDLQLAQYELSKRINNGFILSKERA